MGFTREQLAAFRNATVPDLIGERCDLLFVGINPGLWTAATGTHFCHPSNRFYPALRLAGLVDWGVDTSSGLTESQRLDFTDRGMGITNLVARATIRASELTKEELVAGSEDLMRVVSKTKPAVVAIAGVTAYRSAFRRPRASIGLQEERIETSSLWVVPNPSGLNAHETAHTLAASYREVAVEAGLL